MTARKAFEAYRPEVPKGVLTRCFPASWMLWQAAWQAALATAPAWHPAPTVPGDWICRGKSGATYWQGTVTQEEIDAINQEEITGGGWIGRWYGPIPEDKP